MFLEGICINSGCCGLGAWDKRATISRSTLADASEQQDWRIYADFAQSLIRIARPLYADEDLGLDLDNTIYALDASTIDLCHSVFP